MASTVESDFQQALLNSAADARKIGYNPTRFNQMVAQLGGVATARRLLSTGDSTSGFAELYTHGRLDLSLEALVLKTPYYTLFTEEEIAVARQRLIDAGYLKGY
ncbi:hypothetical protein [Deinococcus aquatilis]|uniref:hypothetical protein n=1 Tax=Deinococcus aquatilis TaxID=519440 RepID=UPI00036852C7|nr:hypothetical protein [Deinococcus aquatilis]